MEIFTDIRRIYIFIVIIIRNYRTINNRALSILLLFWTRILIIYTIKISVFIVIMAVIFMFLTICLLMNCRDLNFCFRTHLICCSLIFNTNSCNWFFHLSFFDFLINKVQLETGVYFRGVLSKLRISDWDLQYALRMSGFDVVQMYLKKPILMNKLFLQ